MVVHRKYLDGKGLRETLERGGRDSKRNKRNKKKKKGRGERHGLKMGDLCVDDWVTDAQCRQVCCCHAPSD